MKNLKIQFVAVLILAGIAFGFNDVLTSFNSGELSPQVKGRIDITRYKNGCTTMENMFCSPYGGAEKRPGTKYIADVNDNGSARLITFEYSVTDQYIIEIGNGYMRFYRSQ